MRGLSCEPASSFSCCVSEHVPSDSTGVVKVCLSLSLCFCLCFMPWSAKMPLAHVGAVLSLLDGPTGCDPGFYVLWCRFRLLRRCLASRPLEVVGLYSLLGLVSDGCPGHGPMHLLVESAGIIGFAWDPVNAGWSRPGLPVLQHLVGPYQHFKAAIWEAWKLKFRGGPLLDIAGSLQLLHCPTCERKG